LKSQLATYAARFDKKNTEKLHKYLQEETNQSLVEGIELFVASLRCSKSVTNVDVELYL